MLEFDNNYTHYNILMEIFHDILDYLKKNNLEIIDINKFYNEYMYFMYDNSSKKSYKYFN